MKVNNKKYAVILLVLSSVFYNGLFAQQTGTIDDLRTNIQSQAEAIAELTKTAQEIQSKLGVKEGNVELASLQTELQRVQQPGNNVAAVNGLLEVAKVQSKVLNQLADLVVRLQHAVGIQPEGMDAALQGANPGQQAAH